MSDSPVPQPREPEYRGPQIALTAGAELAHADTPTLPWLWQPYLAFGALSVLDGDPGVGKSLVTIDLAARLSRHFVLPGDAPAARNPVTGTKYVSTVFVNAEDDVRRTILPRYLLAGGIPHVMAFMGGVGEGGPNAVPVRFPDDLRLLEQILVGRPGTLAVLDPMMALLGPRVAANSDQSVREVLTPLARIAARTRTCILLVRHLTKSKLGRSLYRGCGSIGIVGACRTALMVGRHPDDPDRRVLSLVKTNLGPPAPSLSYRIDPHPGMSLDFPLLPGDEHPVTGETVRERTSYPRDVPAAPVVRWEGVSALTADDVCEAKPDHAGPAAKAAAWLRKVLADGPVPAARIESLAHAEGFGYRTVQLAKGRLGVDSQRVTSEGVAQWLWSLPEPEAQ